MVRLRIRNRTLAALLAVSLAAGVPVSVPMSARAGGYHHYGGYHGYHAPYRWHYGYHHYPHSGVSVGIHGHGGEGAAIALALGAGLLLGYLWTRPPAYASAPIVIRQSAPGPTFGYGKRVARNCKPTTGRGLYRGRPAIFGATFCYDANGVGYIVPGSDYLIGYAG